MSGFLAAIGLVWQFFGFTCIYFFLLTTSILHIRSGVEGTAGFLGRLQKRVPQNCMAFPDVHDKESPSPFRYYLRAPTTHTVPRIRLTTDTLFESTSRPRSRATVAGCSGGCCRPLKGATLEINLWPTFWATFEHNLLVHTLKKKHLWVLPLT